MHQNEPEKIRPKPLIKIGRNNPDQGRNHDSGLKRTVTYALVICNHSPTPGGGRGVAVEISSVFTFALSPQCGGNTRDLCYIEKTKKHKTYKTWKLYGKEITLTFNTHIPS